MNYFRKAVEIFNQIRDIPYHIPINKNEVDDCCEGKNSRLGEALASLGYRVRPRVGLMRWSEQRLPKELLRVPHNDESSHYFIEVVPPGESNWVIVDASNNDSLRRGGFRVSSWDGKTTTDINYHCYKILKPEETESYLESIDYQQDYKENGKFYKALNNYCDSFLKEE